MKKFFVLLLISTSFLMAVVMSPMLEEIDSLKKRQLVFRVLNPTNRAVATTFYIKELIDTSGKREVRVDTKKVVAYPSQFVLKPKEEKRVRVRYMGSKLPDIEEVYRVVAHELNINVDDTLSTKNSKALEGKIDMRITYEGLLLVHKPDAKPILRVESFNFIDRNSLKITLSNSGTASIVPNQNFYRYIIVSNGKEYLIEDKILKKSIFKRVLAGKSSYVILKGVKNSLKIDSIRLEKKR